MRKHKADYLFSQLPIYSTQLVPELGPIEREHVPQHGNAEIPFVVFHLFFVSLIFGTALSGAF